MVITGLFAATSRLRGEPTLCLCGFIFSSGISSILKCASSLFYASGTGTGELQGFHCWGFVAVLRCAVQYCYSTLLHRIHQMSFRFSSNNFFSHPFLYDSLIFPSIISALLTSRFLIPLPPIILLLTLSLRSMIA